MSQYQAMFRMKVRAKLREYAFDGCLSPLEEETIKSVYQAMIDIGYPESIVLIDTVHQIAARRLDRLQSECSFIRSRVKE